MLRVSDIFDANDMKFTGWGSEWEEPDIIWVTPDKLTPDLIKSGIPIILEDHRTGPDIYAHIREQYHGNARALVKMMALKDRDEYNGEHTNWIAHCHRIAQANPDISCEGGLTGEHLEDRRKTNIRVLWNWIAWPLFRPTYEPLSVSYSAQQFRETDISAPREYDVNLVGCVNFEPNQIEVPHANREFEDTCKLLTRHRRQAWDQLEKISRPKLTDDPSSEAERVSRLRYLKDMQNSKIVISPWGWEPWTYRDLEAILCGCVVIKPDTSFVETWPEIPHINCRTDFADLPELIDQIIDNWDQYEDYRRENYNKLHGLKDKDFVGRFASIVKDYVFQNVI